MPFKAEKTAHMVRVQARVALKALCFYRVSGAEIQPWCGQVGSGPKPTGTGMQPSR